MRAWLGKFTFVFWKTRPVSPGSFSSVTDSRAKWDSNVLVAIVKLIEEPFEDGEGVGDAHATLVEEGW
jgi:hypothetical protein